MHRSLVALAVTTALLGPATAKPCAPMEGPTCLPGGLVPGADAVIPANADTLIWRQPRPWPDAGGIDLQRSDGGAIGFELEDTTSREKRITLTQPLEPGTEYRVQFTEPCEPERPGEQKLAEFSFTASEAAPAPTRLGRLVEGTPEIREAEVGTSSGACVATRTVVVHPFTHEEDPGLVPFRALTRYQLLVDGVLWAAGDFGQPASALLDRPPAAYCDGPAGRETGLLSAADHRVELAAEILGVEGPPPIAFTARLHCTAPHEPSSGSGCTSVSTASLASVAGGGASLLALSRRKRRSPEA